MERQGADSTTRRDRDVRGRAVAPERDEAALMARYERLLAALERSAATRARGGLATRLGRGRLARPPRA